MQIKKHDSGYTMWLSANDTYNWAHRVDNAWPSSELSNNAVCVYVDDNGLCGVTINRKYNADCIGKELEAIVADHLPDDCKHLWPCWN